MKLPTKNLRTMIMVMLVAVLGGRLDAEVTLSGDVTAAVHVARDVPGVQRFDASTAFHSPALADPPAPAGSAAPAGSTAPVQVLRHRGPDNRRRAASGANGNAWVQQGPLKSSMQRQHDARRQAAGPTIPGSNMRPVWKTPYAYGYFGASSKKQWSKSYGYHDRHTAWILR